MASSQSRWWQTASAAALLAGCASVPTHDAIAPNEHLRAERIPPIPRSLASQVERYTEFRPFGFVTWHPQRDEMIVRHRSADASTLQIHRLSAPEAALEALTAFSDPIVSAAYMPSDPTQLVYARDTGGNEANKLYRLDLASRESALLSPEDEGVAGSAWSKSGDRLLIATLPLDRTAKGGSRDEIFTTLWLVDPHRPSERRRVARLPGAGWGGYDFAPDDKTVVAGRAFSATEAQVWTIDIATGGARRVLPVDGDARRIAYDGFAFSRDGRRVFLTTDEFGEFAELAVLDLDTHRLQRLSTHIPWNAERFALSWDGRHLAAVFNVDGRDELRLFDANDGRELNKPDVPSGAIGNLSWHRSLKHKLGFSLNSPHSPGDAYAFDADAHRVQRWTAAIAPLGIDPSEFPQPEIVRWTSFDGRTISGLLHMPPARFTGPRPVLVVIHGGPESQATVGFLGRTNYFLQELGIAIVQPNVRGSSGYGKSFLVLVNGYLREDSVKDIGALLDWLPSHERLDASRVAVMGGSYGGYMTLASAVHYSARLRGAIDIVGISSFTTFLRNTESYRRDLRRVEYGDERDPKMRDFLDRIAPLNNAERIAVPLFVIQGRNDPRVPWTEAEQIVARVRENDVPVWYLIADNEGHGFARKPNIDFQFYATIRFLEATLLDASH